MASRRDKRSTSSSELTDRYQTGNLDGPEFDSSERFSSRNKNAQQNKTLKTSALRAAGQESIADLESLPIGQVTQVYSRYSEVLYNNETHLAVSRKTLNKVSQTQLVVGDLVRFRDTGAKNEAGRPEAVIEYVLPRKTILTRADSFKGLSQHPIVANADQMLIVVSLREPTVKWGLVDRMIVAAQSGGLAPIVCVNKLDLAEAADPPPDLIFAREVLAHYASLGITTAQTSATASVGLDSLRQLLRDRATVLSGHSGVGKSSLLRAIQPSLDLRVGDISAFTGKGRHTTTSARRYDLDIGGSVIDTPGVKLFGLWGVTAANLSDFFKDIQADTAPTWRQESFDRIKASLE